MNIEELSTYETQRWNTGISSEKLLLILDAISQVYPMIVFANLTKNTYCMLRNEEFLYNKVPDSGTYDDLIDDNVSNIHFNYQNLFLNCFSKEHLLNSYKKGKTELYAEMYQKNTKGSYHKVSIHVIKVEDPSGDICHICLNRVLDGIVEENYGTSM